MQVMAARGPGHRVPAPNAEAGEVHNVRGAAGAGFPLL